MNESPGAGIIFLSGETIGIPSAGAASKKSPPNTNDPYYVNEAGTSFNSGNYHGNPGRVVLIVGGQEYVFSYTGAVQTFTVN